MEICSFLFFVGGIVVATALEYVTAGIDGKYFPHFPAGTTGDNKFNFQGRICLGFSLWVGPVYSGAVRVLHPVVSDIVNYIPEEQERLQSV